MLDEGKRVIPERNAFIMGTLLQSVVNGGTGSKAHQALKRNDLFGKTGTTNDSFDTWFAGFQPTMVGIAWVGYDTPRQLGVRGETGGSLSLPIWVGFMETALQGVPVSEPRAPHGVVNVERRVVLRRLCARSRHREPRRRHAGTGADCGRAGGCARESAGCAGGAQPHPRSVQVALEGEGACGGIYTPHPSLFTQLTQPWKF